MHYLQNRWKVEGRFLCYYGLRNRKDMFHNRIKLNEVQLGIISSLPKVLTEKEKKALGKLRGRQIVTKEELRKTPGSLEEATFCVSCAANDFMIPGLEFDNNGQCPMCQTKDIAERLKSVVPLIDEVPKSKKSRFDIAVFYTGGKDSTFLLYYLAKVKKLRVLALTWEIPFISPWAKESIEGAKKAFSNVEFITRKIAWNDLKKVYEKLYSLSGNTCACPSLAYLLFYPELVNSKVPFFVAGNEPVQILGLYYNNLAPEIAYRFPTSKSLNFLINVGRILTLHPPLRQGQFQALMTMKHLAYGPNVFVKLSKYRNELTENVVKAIHEVPEFLPPFRKAIRRSSWTGNIPAFIHFDFDKISGGTYDWNKVRDILKEECGWVAPEEANKALHTSCKIERCKDYTQFHRFYYMKSEMIPFSALEISLASRKCYKSKDEAIREIKASLGFTLDDIDEMKTMCGVLNDKGR